MIHSKRVLPPLMLFALLGCNSEDPRIPGEIYAEALKLNQAGNYREAKSLYEQLANRYPDTKAGQQARKDIYMVEAFLKQEITDKQKQTRMAMKRLADAITRYHTKKGEYPLSLHELLPDYLDKIPETPWGHPFFYRTFVKNPIEDLRDRRGRSSQRFNTRLDTFYLACLGTDLQPGGTDLAADMLIVNGEFYTEKQFPPVSDPQPVR